MHTLSRLVSRAVSEYGDSALHYAAARGDASTVRALLSGGAEVNRRNCYSATPLWNSSTRHDTLTVLLGAGAATGVSSTGALHLKVVKSVFYAVLKCLELEIMSLIFTRNCRLQFGSKRLRGLRNAQTADTGRHASRLPRLRPDSSALRLQNIPRTLHGFPANKCCAE